jgi:hypothetical protein
VAESVKVDLQENAPHRVALDLAYHIAKVEGKYTGGDRDYWLKLYLDARGAVIHNRLPT